MRHGQTPNRQASNSAILDVLVKNATGADLTAAFPIVRLTTPVNSGLDADVMARRSIVFNGDKPDADTGSDFAILQSPVLTGKIGSAAIRGYSFCQINVTDADHTFATSSDTDATKLVSGSAGVPIIWKETGTGTKYGIVNLGGGGSGSASGALAIVKGTVGASSAIDVTGTLSESNAVVTVGTLTASATDTTFTTGALLVNQDGKPIFVDGALRALDVLNPSYTAFAGEGPGVFVAGSVVELDGSEFFILPRFELRTEPSWALGSSATDDAQALYHAGGSRAQLVGREDCP
jgi:hypothetical protein